MIFIVLAANCIVDKDSSNYYKLGVIQAIIIDFVAPPKESINNLVNLESLYGI